MLLRPGLFIDGFFRVVLFCLLEYASVVCCFWDEATVGRWGQFGLCHPLCVDHGVGEPRD